MIIGFVRHGETDWNKEGRSQGHRDIELNEEGQVQAHAVAKRLSAEQWDILISSDLLRAQETAQIISQLLKKPVQLDKRLRERSFGQLEGTTEQERIDRWGSGWESLDLNVETLEHMLVRSTELMHELVVRYSGQKILLVSHGTFIAVTLKHLLGGQEISTLGNTSISVIRKEVDCWRGEMINCFKHLGDGSDLYC
ncbi:histidine phosphatase family protein [Paenibacillus sp. LMG 31456]|uniref:Histidine phosphatase family protein n=1 Tax=Paenibacillus foliorum TaxID=2654974 RepID=A0A972GNP9_9BACL|nr:histidine phosphatase family protein [Paenibacillus foliorum]NOU94121.1 histidine phosphatase family protein [Paenibacillus foliorum]